MCGICGMVGFANQDILKEMCRIMSHRGPDDEGYFIDREVALGMRRLSIIDLETGHQPIHNEDGTVQVILNGEIYNYKELTHELRAKGHRFYTNSDTEVLVHLYEDLKEDCVHKLRGMFAFAIWDKNKQKLFLIRDRLGIKPLYYAMNNGKLIFASEIKSILQADTKRDINLESLHYFLTFLYIPAPLTIFKEIKKLPPGHMLTFQKGEFKIKQYWNLRIDKDKEKREEYYTEKIYEILKEAVKMRLISDVPLGAFLSGGIDSSTVVGLMSGVCSKPVKTFSIGYGESEESYNELKYTRIISKCFGTDHHEFILKPKVLELIPKLIWYLDEPFADSSVVPTYLVSQATRENVTVALSGIGGDELFAGYPRYVGMKLASYYEKIPICLRKNVAKFTKNLPESTKSRNIEGYIKRFAQGGMLSPEERYINWISFLDEEEKEELYTEKAKKDLRKKSSYDLHLRYLKEVNSQNLLDRIFYLDLQTYLPDDLLFMGDRMSMANSLELRVPFCDHKLVEFSASIPYNLKMQGLNLKSLLKKSVKNLLPESIIRRKKQGFMLPLGSWFQKELKSFVSQVLLEERTLKRAYFQEDSIKKMLSEHYRGRKNYTNQIWALLTLEVWHRIFIDNEDIPTSPPSLKDLGITVA